MPASEKLAIHGGPSAVTAGPLVWPINTTEIETSLLEAYKNGSWGEYTGQNSARLITALQHHFSSPYVQLLSSGTLGVELALRAVGVAAGDEVILAGYDFPGNFRAIEMLGARPVLLDIAPQTWSLDIQLLKQLTETSRVRAILVSHLHGDLVPMAALMKLASERGWYVIEDACQVPGAKIGSQPCGSWGDVGVLSFGGSKLLSAGRGGALLTQNPEIAQRAKIYSERGNQAFPLSELQAAVLTPQLKTLSAQTKKRHSFVQGLLRGLASLQKSLTPVALKSFTSAQSTPAYYKVGFLLNENLLPQKAAILAALAAEGVPVGQGFRGFTTRSTARCRKIGSLSHSLRASQQTLLLAHPLLLKPIETLPQVIRAFEKVFGHFETE